MHIPDGFLDTKTVIIFNLISSGFIGYGLSKIGRRRDAEKSIPLMGVTAAFIFSAQMLNFPVLGGTSGHFMGSTLASILLGPFTGSIIMTIVLILQAFLFQDGGVLTLGANVFNIGIIGSFTGFFLYIIFKKIIKNEKGLFIGGFIGSWFATVLASISCSFQLAISGTSPINIALPSMALIHILIGIGEGIITTIVLFFIINTRKDLLEIQKF